MMNIRGHIHRRKVRNDLGSAISLRRYFHRGFHLCLLSDVHDEQIFSLIGPAIAVFTSLANEGQGFFVESSEGQFFVNTENL
jgi:hypothetical protein